MRSVAVVALSGLLLLSAQGIQAVTFTVNSTADGVDTAPGDGACASVVGGCTLRAAVQEANALSGADVVDLPAGYYTLTIPGADEDAGSTGDLDINDDLTIQGVGDQATVVDGGAIDRVLDANGMVNIVLTRLTVRNGHTTSDGAGVRTTGSVAINISESSLLNNSSGAAGGGVYLGCCSGNLTIARSRIAGNSAESGAAISCFGMTTATVSASTLEQNMATTSGGAFLAEMAQLAVFTDTVVQDNDAPGGGGGLVISDRLIFTNGVIKNNTALSGRGGGILARDAFPSAVNVTITGSAVVGNTASEGGAIAHSRGTVRFADSLISGNRAIGGSGGAISNRSTMLLTNVTVSGNTASGGGGGLYNSTGASGGIGRATLRNVTLVENNAANGGGLFNDPSDSSIGTIKIRDTLLALNSASPPDCDGLPIESEGFNLIGDATGCSLVGQTASDIAGDPAIGTLGDNGGRTETHALLLGSPAIDAGDPAGCTDADGAPLATDQRGFPRPSGSRCDIGAFEVTKPDADLAMCLASASLQDADADGIPDPLDRCPGTPGASSVDDSGCSQAQFCGAIDVTVTAGVRLCKRADWHNDEVLMRARDRDCTVDRGGAGPEDDRCVPVP